VLGHSASGPERTRLQPFSKANLARIFGLLLARARLSTDTNTLPCLCLSVCLSCLLERSASHDILSLSHYIRHFSAHVANKAKHLQPSHLHKRLARVDAPLMGPS
jgi:hypothetical protein